jgi:tetratricopeptide (TPR) repeat protein
MAKRVRQRSADPERKPNRQNGPTRLAEARPATPDAVALPMAPSAEAVSLFERGMKTLQQHEYTDASEAFRALIHSHPKEGALCERSMVYLALCERELARRPLEPRTVEERLTAATAALNNGEDDRAQTLARSVLSDAPQHDLALYLLAAIEARRGSAEGALHLLGRAMAVNPEIRAQARHDEDFEDLRALDAFRDLIDAPVGPASDASRRQRRNR